MRKVQNHDYLQEVRAKPDAWNQSVSQYHKLKKKLTEEQAMIYQLGDQLKKIIISGIRKNTQDMICHFQ